MALRQAVLITRRDAARAAPNQETRAGRGRHAGARIWQVVLRNRDPAIHGSAQGGNAPRTRIPEHATHADLINGHWRQVSHARKSWRPPYDCESHKSNERARTIAPQFSRFGRCQITRARVNPPENPRDALMKPRGGLGIIGVQIPQAAERALSVYKLTDDECDLTRCYGVATVLAAPASSGASGVTELLADYARRRQEASSERSAEQLPHPRKPGHLAGPTRAAGTPALRRRSTEAEGTL